VSAGKSPMQDRALDLLRQGTNLFAVAAATGTPTATIKRWARAAGASFAKPTEDQREQRLQQWKRTAKGRRAYDMRAVKEAKR
jgi:hypothetical protein